MIDAKVVAHSKCEETGAQLWSLVCVYPRFIHSEVMTHRALSRNAASSRAIPTKKMLAAVWNNEALPTYWGSNRPGMQAGDELTGWRLWAAKKLRTLTGRVVVGSSWGLNKLGLHKQVANRGLEPWSHMTTLISATEWRNFFRLRVDPDAQPEFQVLSLAMLRAMAASTPKILKAGEWHLPFWRPEDEAKLLSKFSYTMDLERWHAQMLSARLKICTARCARTSYENFYGKDDFESDCKLHDDLMNSGHWSPFEHPARALAEPRRYGNFVGYSQYRKEFLNENRGDDGTPFDAAAMLQERLAVLGVAA